MGAGAGKALRGDSSVKYLQPTGGESPHGGEKQSSPSSSGSKVKAVTSEGSGGEAGRRRSRVAQAVDRAKNWSQAEMEQLPVPQLCRWLEALGTDFTPAIARDQTIARLWAHVDRARPPALQAVTSPEHLQYWPVPEMVRWLEYFGAADEGIADKPALVRMLLDHGEELPAPTFLGESAEDAFITQVTQHIAMVKNAATTLLAHLSRDTALVEAQERAKHSWHANGRIVAEFKSWEFDQAYGSPQGASAYLDVDVGEEVDVTVHEASGWAWCIKGKAAGSKEGWVTATSVVEVATVLEATGGGEEGEDALSLPKGVQVEVVLRHYSGWSLVRMSHGATAEAVAPAEGWVSDACLSDHPRNEATKKHRLLLNGLQRLADDATQVEAAFYLFRTQGPEGAYTTLEGLYNQVLGLVEEYQNICGVFQMHAAADMEAQQAKQAAKEAERQAREAESRKRDADNEKAWLELPGWVVEGKRCYWVSKVQKKNLRVNVKKVCRVRRQVLVTFDSDSKARKVVSFDAFQDMSTCPLQRSKARRRRKGGGDGGEAQAADDDAADELDDDIRNLLRELGPQEALRESSSESESSDESDDESTAASRRASEERSSPPGPEGAGTTSSPSNGGGERSAGGADGSTDAAAAADAKAAAGKASAGGGAGVDGMSEMSEDAPSEGDVPAPPAAEDSAAARAPPFVPKTPEDFAAVKIQALARRVLALRRAVKRLAATALRGWLTAAGAPPEALPELPPLAPPSPRRPGAAAAAARGPGGAARGSPPGSPQGSAFSPTARKSDIGACMGPGDDAEDAAASQPQAAGGLGEGEAVSRLQQVSRMYSARCTLAALADARSAAAATVLQTGMRGALARRHTRPLIGLRRIAVVRIQASERSRRARREAAKRRAARCEELASLVLCCARTAWARAELAELRAQLRARAAVALQRHGRGLICRRRYRSLLQRRFQAACRVQGLLLMRRARAELARRRVEHEALRLRTAIRMQSWWRGHLARKLARELFPLMRARHHAALRIQGLARIRRARRELKRLRKERAALEARSATRLQSFRRGLLVRRSAAPLIAARQRVAPRLQGLSRMYRARLELRRRRREREELLRRIAAVTCIASAWRGHATRRRVAAMRLRYTVAATRIQAAGRGRAARRRVLPVIRLRRAAALRIQCAARGRAARRRARQLRMVRAALQVETAWRGFLGRRALMRLRARAVTSLIDVLWSSPGELGADNARRDGAWLGKVTHALDWKDTTEQAEEERQLNMRRIAHSDAIVSASDAAVLDRSLAAAALARRRARMRMRALLLTQVADAAVPCDPETQMALRPSHSLVCRLTIADACDEAASLVQTAWVITVSSRGSRPAGVPSPDEVLHGSLGLLMKRLTAELGITMRGKDARIAEVNDDAYRLLTREEASAVAEAERQAGGIRQRALGALSMELQGASAEASTALAKALEATKRVTAEVQILRSRREVESQAAELALKKDRTDKHAMTVALNELTLTTQVEKERLESELSERRPRAVVFQHILATAKRLQEELKQQEVNGMTNRKSQGLLAHTLRALESRAAKGLDDCVKKLRADGFAPPSNEAMTHDDDMAILTFKLSDNVKSKQEKYAEQERQFWTGLENDVLKARSERDAETRREVAVLGAKLRAAAEVHGEDVRSAIERLTAWRDDADKNRPWLAELVPVARSNATVSAAARLVREASEEGGLLPMVRAAARRLQSLELFLAARGPAESPRAGTAEQLLGKLQEVQKTIGVLRKEYPDVAPQDRPQPVAAPPEESPNAHVMRRLASDGTLSIPDDDGDSIADGEGRAGHDSPTARRGGHDSPTVGGAGSPVAASGWAAMAQLGNELFAGAPQAAAASGAGATGGGMFQRPPARPAATKQPERTGPRPTTAQTRVSRGPPPASARAGRRADPGAAGGRMGSARAEAANNAPAPAAVAPPQPRRAFVGNTGRR